MKPPTKEQSLKRITIERYQTPTSGYAGCIEGETDDGTQWILFVDEIGKPEVFWPDRDKDGAVLGTAVPLTLEANRRATELRRAKMAQILDFDPDPAKVVQRLRRSLETDGADVDDAHFDLRNQRVFGRSVSPEKPSL